MGRLISMNCMFDQLLLPRTADPIEDWPSLSQLMRDPCALLLNTSYVGPQGNLYVILTLGCLLIPTLHWFLTLTLRCLLTLLTLRTHGVEKPR